MYSVVQFFTFTKITGTLRSTRGVTRVMEEASGSSSEYMQF